MQVLGLESSCDETGVAIYDIDHGLIGDALHSQIDLHRLYGGVVPELASRDHIRRLTPLVRQVLSEAGLSLQQLDGIAYTSGPGLAGALMTGAMYARSLAFGLSLPAVEVHHMEGHLLAPLLGADPPEFPFVCLLVSGGHTLLVRVDAVGRYQVLGESVDDAAGEAFDKTAKLLGLPYPGGPELARLADSGDPQRFDFPRPMTDRPGLDFSFSGLKTAAITQYQRLGELQEDDATRASIAASFQRALVETLRIKCDRALAATQLNRLVVSGGVSANRVLRESFRNWFEPRQVTVSYPSLAYCTDNGAMIALAGALRLAAGQSAPLGVEIRPRWSLESLLPVDSAGDGRSAP